MVEHAAVMNLRIQPTLRDPSSILGGGAKGFSSNLRRSFEKKEKCDFKYCKVHQVCVWLQPV